MSLEFTKISGSTPYFLNSASTAEELTVALEDYMRTGTQIIFQHDGEDCILSSFEYKAGIDSTVIAYFVTPKKKLLKVDTAAGYDLVITESEITPELDITLTQAGKAADAKATGEAITSIKKDITWENLPDKPFGETVSYSDTLTVDMSVFDRDDVITDENGMFVKVSDAAPTIDDFANGCVISANGEMIEIPYSEILAMYNELGSIVLDFVVFVQSDNLTPDLDGLTPTFPEQGTYILKSFTAEFTSFSVKIPNYKGFESIVVKPIDEKYLPIFETVSGEDVSLGDTVSWDGNIETFEGVKTNRVTNESVGSSVQAVKVSDSIPSASDIGSNSTLKYVSGGNEVSNSITHISENDDGSLTIGDDSMLPIQIIPTDNFTNSDGITYPEAGTYFTLLEVNGQKLYATEFTIPNYTFTIKQPDKEVIKPELLPESGGLSIKKIEFTDRPTAYAWLVENYLSVTRCVLRTNTSEYPFIYDSVDLAGDAIRFTKINFGIGGSDQVYHGYFLLAFTPTETKVTLTAAEIDFRSDGTITIGNNEVTALTDDYWSVVDASIEIYYMG